MPLKAVPEGGNTVPRCTAGICLLVGLIHFDLPLIAYRPAALWNDFG